MDLDKMKKVWQETSLETNLNESKVQKMLDNTRGKTALEKLIGYEKLGRILLFACMLISPLFLKYGILVFAMYWLILIPSTVWTFYKVKYLCRIDIATMDILSLSSTINKYKKYLKYEFWVGMIWLVFFLYAFVWSDGHLGKDLLKGETTAIVIFIGLVLFVIVFILLVYYFMYWKNIKKIQESIKEVQYFEEGNN